MAFGAPFREGLYLTIWDKTLLCCTPNRRIAHLLVPGAQTKLATTAALKICLLGPKLVFEWFPVLHHK